MSAVEIIVYIVLLLGELGAIYLAAHTKRYAQNMADILQNREKSYETEKGKNLATKEDIAEITRKMEDVKTEISLSKQKRYEQLVEQERILIELLHEATVISQTQNKLLLYLYDTSTRTRYDSLVETVNDTLTRFYHLSNLALVSVPIADVDKIIENLSVPVTYLALQVNVKAANAANLAEQFNNQMDFALTKAQTDNDKTVWLASAVQTKGQIEQMRNEPVDGKDRLREAISNYTEWLKQLYGKEFFMFKS